MSILIKGMEMPRSCFYCQFQHKNTTECLITHEYYNWGLTTPPSDCPLVELPPHGRLIDADALTDAIELIDWYHQNKNKDMVEGANSDEEQAWYREQDIYAAIEDAPTIIESEYDNG